MRNRLFNLNIFIKINPHTEDKDSLWSSTFVGLSDSTQNEASLGSVVYLKKGNMSSGCQGREAWPFGSSIQSPLPDTEPFCAPGAGRNCGHK